MTVGVLRFLRVDAYLHSVRMMGAGGAMSKALVYVNLSKGAIERLGVEDLLVLRPFHLPIKLRTAAFSSDTQIKDLSRTRAD